jgi:hypothetical protein
MGWLRKRGREAKPTAEGQEKTANKIAERILAAQSSTAARLNALAQKMGRRNTLVLLGALLIGFACYLIYIMINAIF